MPVETLVLDTSPLTHFARAGRLEALEKLLLSYDCVTTRAVVGELERGTDRFPELRQALSLDWLRVVPCDGLDELYIFSQYMNQLGNSSRNAGECSVLAWAECHGASAYVDDQVAHNIARARGVPVYRTLRLIIAAYRCEEIDEPTARNLVQALADTEARFPADACTDLFAWARAQSPPLL